MQLLFTLMVIDCFVFAYVGPIRKEKKRYLIPIIGGWMALHARLNPPNTP